VNLIIIIFSYYRTFLGSDIVSSIFEQCVK